MKKKIFISAGLVSAGLLGMAGTSLAATNNSGSANSLPAKIAKQFNLSQADVQKVFDQNRADRQAAKKATIDTELTQAVTDGKITNDQKAKILAKIDGIQKQRQAKSGSLKDKTPAERQALVTQNRTALEKWASDNNIPSEFLGYLMGGRGHGLNRAQ